MSLRIGAEEGVDAREDWEVFESFSKGGRRIVFEPVVRSHETRGGRFDRRTRRVAVAELAAIVMHCVLYEVDAEWLEQRAQVQQWARVGLWAPDDEVLLGEQRLQKIY